MRVPIGWLREFVDVPDDAGTIADRLASLGFPVAEIERRPEITGVVVGKVLDIAKHPNADRLQVAHIDVGDEEPLTIATAATNVAAGQTIAVARIGARLPQLTIAPRTMRGVASQGMMISAEELALPAEWFEDGILQLDAETPAGADAVALFGLNDAVLDVEITTNRVDAMSMLGIARELAASYSSRLRMPQLLEAGDRAAAADPGVAVEIASDGCTRFVTQRFEGLRGGVAPAWMRVRLALAGQRPIDAVVDVSNYVMLETGQPMHFYDAAQLSGSTLIVRDAREGETIVTLDGIERTLAPATMVVADDRRALGIAGIMGGRDSEVSSSTSAIVLEAATFDGARVRRAAKTLGLRTEAASRHEKTLPPRLADFGAARAAWLLTRMGATASAPRAYGDDVDTSSPIALRSVDVRRLLGLDVPAHRIVTELQALGCAVEASGSGDEFEVVPPWWRRDLIISADLVEEIARMEGYDRIEAAVPSVAPHAISSDAFDRDRHAAHALASLGYREIVTYSLRPAHELERARRAGFSFGDRAVEVLNPLSEDQRFLRTSLAGGFVTYCAQVDKAVRVFETGDTFGRGEDGGIEERTAAIFGFAAEPIDEPAWHDTHFLRLKGDCETLLERLTGRTCATERTSEPGLHPGKTAALTIDGIRVATLGAVDPRLSGAFEARLPLYLAIVAIDALPAYAVKHYRPPSKFPGTSRDLALTLDVSIDASRVERTIVEAIGETCTSATAFDEYRGPQVPNDKKSLTVRVELQLHDATITDAQADAAIERAREALELQLGATLRS